MIDLLIILLKPALQCVEGGKWWLFPFALVAWVVDFIIARTTFALVVGRFPQNGERTVSDMLENLCVTQGPDQELYIQIAKKINRDTGFHHIKVV